MTSSGNDSAQRPAVTKRRRALRAIIVVASLLASSIVAGQTVRDDFSTRLYSNNDGSVNWSGDWIENDLASAGPTRGNVWITNGGEVRLEDFPNTGTQPSLAREANLLGASTATFSFNWRTTNGVDPSDSLVVEVSANGGATWSTLEDFTGLNGANSGSRAYDISAFASSNTRIRFRVNNLYGAGNETFRVDFVEIAYTAILSGTDLSVTQTDSPDPVNVVNPLAYSLTVMNAGPDAASGVTLSDVLPAGTNFQSASASQGSCSQIAGTVTCNIGNLAAGSSATVNVTVTAPFAIGTITNTATVTGNETDPAPGNNVSAENTVVQNLNVNQLCYLVADAGGGAGGNDLFTLIDTADFNPATNETSIGSGTGTSSIEAIAYNGASGVVYAANGNRLGTLNTSSGLFQPSPQTFGTGFGSAGSVSFSDVDGLTYDATLGVMYGSHARSGNDLLFQINMATGAHVANAFGPNVDYVQIQSIAGGTIVDDIAVDPTSGIMYASTNSGGSTDRLVRVNKFTGATTSVAFITVPDIEGLGTDPSGQLWGTSGTQGILYEIDKTSGVGSNGRQIDNGSDYEAIDCYAFSPTVTADLSLSKIVSDATPPEGATVSYTVGVQNTGPAAATVVQLMDLLPAGVTFVSANPGQGTYDPLSGDWFVGNLAAGATANLVLQVNVDSGTAGTTISNTVTVDFLSQTDPNAGNDIASVDISPAGSPTILIVKNALAINDPFNGATNPKAIPGATVQYEIEISNSGAGAVDNDTLVVTDIVPANAALLVADFDGGTAGPLAFVDGTPGSALSYNFTSLGNGSDDLSFSNDGGVSYSYTPVPGADQTDPAVTHLRINPKGAFAGSAGAGDPAFRILFKIKVQ